MRFRTLALFGIFTASYFACSSRGNEIDFSRDIRPILSENCFLCHGPDDSSREADLRLDLRDEAVAAGAISESQWQDSGLLERIKSNDPDAKMPPEASHKHLSGEQIDLIEKWLSQGAKYSQHWAFVPPVRPHVPNDITKSNTSISAIDAFVSAKMSEHGLIPSPQADRAALLRRIYLDLIGLPPSPSEIAEYLRDESPQAYEAAVDRLLNSPQYGEKWARWWLDAARYADSDGYEKDKPREVWFYRDWVINSLNRDLPYNEFVIKQIAGDLLPNASQDDVVATGFLRNSMVNEEGGADPEQFRVEGMFDRVDAIGKAVLGLTTQCAQCHTHKYDPITHTEYYKMFAALNNFHEAIVSVYTPQQSQQIASIQSRMAKIDRDWQAAHPRWRDSMEKWKDDLAENSPSWMTLTPASLPFDGQKFRLLPDGSVVSESYAPTQTTVNLPCDVAPDAGKTITALRLDVLKHPQLPHGGPGRSIYGTGALTEFEATVTPKNSSQQAYKVKFVHAYSDVAADREFLKPCFRQKDAAKDERVTGPISYAIDGDAKTAWTTDRGIGRRNQDCHAIFIPEAPIDISHGATIAVDLKMNHGGWNSDDNQNYLLGRYRLSYTVEDAERTASVPSAIEPIVRIPQSQLTEEQTDALFDFWVTQNPDAVEAASEIEKLWKEYPEAASQLAVQELDTPRDSFVFLRGDFLSHGDRVEPGIPQFLNTLPATQEPARLRFARWLVARDAPTTARAIVNRVWQSYFGRGIVTTAEDFGFQSPPPSHPELLDWLAVEFMDNGWSFKHLHKLILMSSTYRQSSSISDQLAEIDPNNTWLARGPRMRVDAETVRDIALSASGLLKEHVGGPSVYPPAPKFLFEPPASYGPKVWEVSSHGSQYRRSLYVHRYRSVLYPALQVFDAPKAERACVRRERSNTPLQALVMLNETQFVESSRAMAARVLREAPSSDVERIQYAYQLCTGRRASDAEVAILENLIDQQRERIDAGEIDSEALLGVSDAACKQLTGLSANEMAPWIVLCKAVLNLDETITKG
jgi:hypothetical protein